MDKNILELIYDLKKKCIINDDAFMVKEDLTQAEYHTLIAISTCKEINSNLLAKKMDLSLSRISRVIDKLVNRGLMSRIADSSDRRAIKLKLTARGTKLMNKIIEYRRSCEMKILKNVSEKELDLIKKSFNTVLELL